jgi:hypothetical protein
MSQDAGVPVRRAWSNLMGFVVGVPVGIGVLALFFWGPLSDHKDLCRYVEHEVEWVEVVMFFCALAALGAKALGQLQERMACRQDVIPPWDGQPQPVAEAGPIRSHLWDMSSLLQTTVLGRRVAAILDFVSSRGSANELDDQMRSLGDADALAMEGSYSLIRFITWAIPILGFLGTVLGITASISGVTPELLEHQMDKVTGGLALAFDATALGLGLTMVLMFVNFLVERLEQGTLDAVDRYVDAQLAHRFERTGPESGEFVEALRQNSQVLLKAMDQLVQGQANVWAKSLERAEKFWAEGAAKQQERLAQGLDAAIERALERHTMRLIDLEKQSVERSRALYEGITALAGVLRDTGREQQAALADVAERFTAQSAMLGRLQEGEAHLVRLQETMQQNLATLAGAGSFEQAVQSLTAAIHLLTAKSGVNPVAGRIGTRSAA